MAVPLTVLHVSSPPPSSDEVTRRSGEATAAAQASEQVAAGQGWGLVSGQLLAGRYRILRPIAKGGMGEVYEADDLDLRERVALKTILPEVADRPLALERFKREIRLARKVTHPNACRVFDLVQHDEGGSRVAFLTMELLLGETLSQRVRRTGPLREEEALPIARQMAAALDAAHAAGVVHRDFKSGNVLLAPDGERPDGVRAVVTDFGLARSSDSPRDGAHSLSAAEPLTGTPSYMAPEQVEGLPATPASDVYAFGVVLFEMLTGTCPFLGTTPVDTALRRLREPPPSPRTIVPRIGARTEAAILRCLERDPARRFPSAGAAALALADAPAESAPASATPKVRRSRRLFSLALLGGALVALAWSASRLRNASIAPSPLNRPTDRRSFAVLGFQNLSELRQSDWLGTAVSEMLTTELAAGDSLRPIPAENVARARLELELGSGSLGLANLLRVREHLGADLLVLGSYVLLGPETDAKLRLDLRLQDTGGGGAIASFSEVGTASDLFALVARSGDRLRKQLGLAPLSAEQVSQAREVMPAEPEAARLYSEGLASLRLLDAASARDRFERAAQADPGSPLVLSGLAQAYSALGFEVRARKAAEQAFERSGSLPRAERLLTEARLRGLSGDWRRAIQLYRALFEFFPDDVEYGLLLVDALIWAGRLDEVEPVVRAMRALAPPARNDPRIDLVEARAGGTAGDIPRWRAAARRAADKAEARGARLLLARARTLEAGSHLADGDLEEAAIRSAEAARLYGAAGDRGSQARAQLHVAIARERQGDFAVARSLYEEALAAARETGYRFLQGRLQHSLGLLLAAGGQQAEAHARLAEAEAAFRESSTRQGEADLDADRAHLLLELGRLPEAAEACERARAAYSELGNPIGKSHLRRVQALLQLEAGDVVLARREFEQSLEVDRAARALEDQAWDKLGLAEALLEEGRPGPAETSASEALGRFESERRFDGQARALATLALARLAGGRWGEAREAAERGTRLARERGPLRLRLPIEIAAARVRCAEAVEPARTEIRTLSRLSAEARAGGFEQWRLVAEAARGACALGAGEASAREELLTLAARARFLGYERIARGAESAARR